jgi:hypothetical protein
MGPRYRPVVESGLSSSTAFTVLAENPVVVVPQKSRALAPRGGLPKLLLNPAQAQVGRDVDEHDAARGDLHHHEDVHDREEGGGPGEEVHCEDLGSVIPDERLPGPITSGLMSSACTCGSCWSSDARPT